MSQDPRPASGSPTVSPGLTLQRPMLLPILLVGMLGLCLGCAALAVLGAAMAGQLRWSVAAGLFVALLSLGACLAVVASRVAAYRR